MVEHYIAWWNVENLFEEKGSPNRIEKIRRTVEKELDGWTAATVQRKIQQLASVISAMNNGKGPDMLGVCEVENEFVVDKLIAALAPLGRNYARCHHNTGDNRGIDIAFIYDADRFAPGKIFSHVIVKRYATRELFQVNFKTRASNKMLVLVGNHWPSRSAGTWESEPFRMMAGENLSYWNEQILNIHGKDTAVINLGDFNDEPCNRSIVEYAQGEKHETKVRKATGPVMFNLMWPLLATGIGTHYYNGFAVLDQFMVSKGVANGKSGFRLKKAPAQAAPPTDRDPAGQPKGPYDVRIEMFNVMKSGGAYPKPVRFGLGAKADLNGFSDHYPIALVLQEP